MNVKESIELAGAERQLVGTLCLPAEGHVAPIAFILLNAGVISRMGPHRFNVKLARHLAGLGFGSLRFDLSGQGDSRHAASSQPHEAQVTADLSAAMDLASARTGIRRFVIAGICSGANAGLATAQQDPRVVGLWMLDGHAYVTPRSRLARYWQQWTRAFALTLKTWSAKPWAMIRRREAQLQDEDEDDSHKPTRQQYAQAMQALVDRGVRIYIMYTSGVLWQYSYHGQFQHTFGQHAFARLVQCDYLPHIDHTVTSLAAQQEVFSRIGSWAQSLAAPK